MRAAFLTFPRWSRSVVRAALLALAGAGLVAVQPAVAATAPDAVVLVSGFTTTTPFTTPSAQCSGSFPRGQTWTFDGAQYAAAGYNVYTAPVKDGTGPIHNALCPSQLPALMTINSRGNIDANAGALALFIAYLHVHYGVNTVRIVAHSYGGLWTRGALRVPALFPGVRVLSVTTLGTPHLGSFMADIAEGIDPSLCGNDSACQAIAAALVAYRELKFEPALSEATASSVTQWNEGQGTSLSAIPFTAIAGDAVTLPGQTNPYVSPDDSIIGLSSAQAVGLDKAGVIPQLSCFAPFDDVHSATELPFFPNVKFSLTDDPGIVTDVEQTLAGTPPSTGCPNPPATGLEHGPVVTYSANSSVSVPLRVVQHVSRSGLPRPKGDDLIVLDRGTRVRCRGRELASIPLLDSQRLRVIAGPSCGAALTFSHGPTAALCLRRAAGTVTASVRGRRIFVRLHGAAGTLAVAVKRGHRFRLAKLDRQRSLVVGRSVHVVTLHVTMRRRDGRSALAVITVHI